MYTICLIFYLTFILRCSLNKKWRIFGNQVLLVVEAILLLETTFVLVKKYILIWWYSFELPWLFSDCSHIDHFFRRSPILNFTVARSVLLLRLISSRSFNTLLLIFSQLFENSYICLWFIITNSLFLIPCCCHSFINLAELMFHFFSNWSTVWIKHIKCYCINKVYSILKVYCYLIGEGTSIVL